MVLGSWLYLTFWHWRSSVQPDFRVAVTGSVVELDRAVTIMKKLKLQGTPYKIYKNTAFIQVSLSLCRCRCHSCCLFVLSLHSYTRQLMSSFYFVIVVVILIYYATSPRGPALHPVHRSSIRLTRAFDFLEIGKP